MQKCISGQLVSYRVAFIRSCGLELWFCSSLAFPFIFMQLVLQLATTRIIISSRICNWLNFFFSAPQQQEHRNSALKIQLRPLGIAFKWHFVVGAFPQSTRTERNQENKTNDHHQQQHQPTKERVLGRKLLGNSINHLQIRIRLEGHSWWVQAAPIDRKMWRIKVLHSMAIVLLHCTLHPSGQSFLCLPRKYSLLQRTDVGLR